MSEEQPKKMRSMEEAETKSKGYIQAKAGSLGKVERVISWGTVVEQLGDLILYKTEGGLEIEISPESKNFMGQVSKAAIRKSYTWFVQLQVHDLAMFGWKIFG